MKNFGAARGIFLLTWCLVLAQAGYAQRTKTDSLQYLLAGDLKARQRIIASLELADLIYKSKPFEALKYANQSADLAKRIKSDSLLNVSFLRLGNIYVHLSNYPRALTCYQQSIQLSNKLSDDYRLAQTQANLGIIYYYQHDLENALAYYLEALKRFRKLPSEADHKRLLLTANLLNNIGAIHDETKRFDEAGKYYDEALELARQLNEFEIMANVLNNQGTLYRDRGDNANAFALYKEAMLIRIKNNNKLGIARSYHNLGQFYHEKLLNNDSAEQYFKKAIVIGKEIGSWQTVSSASESLHQLYEQRGAYKDAYATLILHQQMNDSLFNEESTRKIAQMEMQFEFDKQQAFIESKQKEKELYYWMMGGGLTLLLIIVTLLFFLQRNKTRRSKLEQANLELEKAQLQTDLAVKDKELAANIMYLLNKNELINTISEKLLDIKQNIPAESQTAVQKVVLDLQSNLQPELWQEFEFRFQQVHENFYRALNDKFPDLSPSERRLCAFLKLNMTTKEISAITHQNAKSIDVARTRLRKKLNLTGTDANLLTFLAQIEAA